MDHILKTLFYYAIENFVYQVLLYAYTCDFQSTTKGFKNSSIV